MKKDGSFIAIVFGGDMQLPEIELKIEIRRNKDGVIATDVWPNWKYNEYWWAEGNASCDCNRELFFLSAIHEPEPETLKCSHGGYSVRLSNAGTGAVLYDEFNSRPKH